MDVYYNLPEDQQWLKPDNPHTLGGRSTDVGQIAMSLRRYARDAYPVNKVPEKIVEALEDVEKHCRAAEGSIQNVIELVSLDIREGG